MKNVKTDPKERPIKVIGIGNAGGNIIDYLYQQQQIKAHFIACDTDADDLEKRIVPDKFLLGNHNLNELFQENEKAIVLVAGLRGITTSDYIPKIAQYSKDKNIPLFAVVNTPFTFEGENAQKKMQETICELEKYTQSFFVIDLEKVKQEYGKLLISDFFNRINEEFEQKIQEISEKFLSSYEN